MPHYYNKLNGLPRECRGDVFTRHNKIRSQEQHIQSILSFALHDGVISDDEIVRLAKLDFTVKDVQNTFNLVWGTHISDDDRQKLIDDLMTRIETYRQLNQEQQVQEPKFGL